jgi:hypothetical protein
MSMVPVADENLDKVKQEIITNFKDMIGKAWDTLSKKDKELLELCAKDAARLQFRGMMSNEDLNREIRIVNASLANLTVAKTMSIQRVFWLSMERAGKTLLTVVVRAAMASLMA